MKLGFIASANGLGHLRRLISIVLKFEELGIVWTKLTVHKDILEYVMDGKVCSYTPDSDFVISHLFFLIID
jgi:hypothetical protein